MIIPRPKTLLHWWEKGAGGKGESAFAPYPTSIATASASAKLKRPGVRARLNPGRFCSSAPGSVMYVT